MNYSSSTQTVGWIKDRYNDGSLIIKPPFQRKPVWLAKQKCYLVESILLQLPIPEIFIQQWTTPAGQTTYAIVDGQQRIRSVLQFVGTDKDQDQQAFNKFPLDKLDVNSTWSNQTFDELSSDEQSGFFGYDFAVRWLKTNSDQELRDMFKRLNKYMTPLTAQELRNAIYTGPFIQAVGHLSDDSFWVDAKLVTPADIRRQSDVEFVSQLLIGVIHGPQSGSPKDIDAYYEQYEDYDDEFPDQKRVLQLFSETLDLAKKIVQGVTKPSRWLNKTDFYSLFVAAAAQFRDNRRITATDVKRLTRALGDFSGKVDRRLGNQIGSVEKDVANYVRAVEKGANDKGRRGDRHVIVTKLIAPFFKKKP